MVTFFILFEEFLATYIALLGTKCLLISEKAATYNFIMAPCLLGTLEYL